MLVRIRCSIRVNSTTTQPHRRPHARIVITNVYVRECTSGLFCSLWLPSITVCSFFRMHGAYFYHTCALQWGAATCNAAESICLSVGLRQPAAVTTDFTSRLFLANASYKWRILAHFSWAVWTWKGFRTFICNFLGNAAAVPRRKNVSSVSEE